MIAGLYICPTSFQAIISKRLRAFKTKLQRLRAAQATSIISRFRHFRHLYFDKVNL